MIGNKACRAGAGLLLIILCSAVAQGSAPPQEFPASKPTVHLTIAVPAELDPAITRLARAFERKNNNTVQITVEALLDSHSVLRMRTNFDVMFSSDSRQLRRLASSGAIGSTREVARDQVVICVSPVVRADFPPRNPLLGLKEKVVSRIVIPDRRTVYGATANQALKSIKIYSPVIAEKLAVGKDLSDIAEQMERGDASAAVLPQSAVETYSLRGTRVIPVPQNLYPPIRLQAGLARRSKHPREAAEFLRFAASDDGKAILRQSGFSEPQRTVRRRQ